jgi:hypothetical protein
VFITITNNRIVARQLARTLKSLVVIGGHDWISDPLATFPDTCTSN